MKTDHDAQLSVTGILNFAAIFWFAVNGKAHWQSFIDPVTTSATPTRDGLIDTNPGRRGKEAFPFVIDEVGKVFNKHPAMLFTGLSIWTFIRLVAEPCPRPKCIKPMVSNPTLVKVGWVLEARADLICVPKLSPVGKLMASDKDDCSQ